MAIVTPSISRGTCSFAITGQTSHAATAAGSLGYFQNPEDVSIIVKSCVVHVLTNSTGVANLTIGHATTVVGTHDTTQLFAAAAMAAAAATAVTGFANGDPADSLPIVPANSFIAAFGSADTTGLTAIAYIEYVRADA